MISGRIQGQVMGNKTEAMHSLWLEKAAADADLKSELRDIQGDWARIEDAFNSDLVFGTGGLRGIIGAGTNRMNVYTVAKASQGLADYVVRLFPVERRSIAVSRDSRIKSDLFARVAAEVFAANGITVHVYSRIMPTPCLSFAVRELHCAAGVMITASHNSAKYNGYKVYSASGCQITTETASDIQAEIAKLDVFSDIKRTDHDDAVAVGMIRYIPDEVYTKYLEQVKKQSLLRKNETADKGIAVVYSPLNGTGLKPVTRVLTEAGYTNVMVVPEQEQPDGNFPTCPHPNPENPEAMALGLKYAKMKNADTLLATDPDCDRIGVAVKSGNDYQLLSGNEVGILLLDYICARRTANSTMPDDPVMIKTIVTTDMGERIAARYCVRTINVLTGFKFIGEQINLLESWGKADQFIFGFEESCGYLSGAYVRDKDAVGAALLICEMIAHYKALGLTLADKLKDLYAAYGYCLNTLHSYEFGGALGLGKMQAIMHKLRAGTKAVDGKKVLQVLDYAVGIDELPKSDVLKFILEDSCSVVVRPSGTEPKLKAYVSVMAKNSEAATLVEAEIAAYLRSLFEL